MISLIWIHLLFLFQFQVGAVLQKHQLKGASDRFNRFSDFISSKQNEILGELKNVEDTFSTSSNSVNFIRDPWTREDPQTHCLVGFGTTGVIEDGNVIEKGAVSTTIQSGTLSAERAAAMSSRQVNAGSSSTTVRPTAGMKYFASALSLVLHSRSPLVPTFRSDVRYFELENGEGWFGGGMDLTPYYIFDDDIKGFHSLLKKLCDEYCDCNTDISQASGLYRRLKKWCDDYFYLPARDEHRGVGGIFFDDLNCLKSTTTRSYNDGIDSAMDFTQRVCDNFMTAYVPIVDKRARLPYSEDERNWQLLRRGRYIEFNLLYDRGVKFGMFKGGRIEAVLVSCPPLVSWKYKSSDIPDDSEKAGEKRRLLSLLKTPIDWV